jgi:hypothetical protein
VGNIIIEFELDRSGRSSEMLKRHAAEFTDRQK